MQTKWLAGCITVLLLLAGLGGCAQPEKPPAMAKAAAAGARFSRTGTVTFHRGEPCTSQIMFDFHSPGSMGVIWLSARMRETKVLSKAAGRGDLVRISGLWREAQNRRCRYVSVTSAEQQQ